MGGFLVQLLGAPLTVLVNAAAMVVSSLFLLSIRHEEDKPKPQPRRRLLKDIGEGVRFVACHPLLRPIALASMITNLGINALIVLMPIMLVQQLGMGSGALGLFFMIGALGAFCGALSAGRISGWLGQGRCLWLLGLVIALGALGVPLTDSGAAFWWASGAWAVSQFGIGMHNVVQVSLRQQVTPTELLGRMTATMRFLLTGTLTVSAVWAGLVAELAGVRVTLWVGAAICALCWLPLLFSPLRSLTHIPTADADGRST